MLEDLYGKILFQEAYLYIFTDNRSSKKLWAIAFFCKMFWENDLADIWQIFHRDYLTNLGILMKMWLKIA